MEEENSEESEKTLEIIKELARKLPKFSDGRINYSKSDIAPVVTVFIKHGEEILLLKRSDKVGFYKGKWNTVAGYLDELKTLKEKSMEEVREEVGISEDKISSMRFGKAYTFNDSEADKTWIVNPVLVELKDKIGIRIDWEHSEYKWIKPDELRNFDVVPELGESLKRVLE